MGNNASKNSKALQSKDSQGSMASMGCNSRLIAEQPPNHQMPPK